MNNLDVYDDKLIEENLKIRDSNFEVFFEIADKSLGLFRMGKKLSKITKKWNYFYLRIGLNQELPKMIGKYQNFFMKSAENLKIFKVPDFLIKTRIQKFITK